MSIRIAITAVGSGIGHAIVQSCRMASQRPYLVGLDASPMAFDAFDCDERHVVPPSSDPLYRDALLRLCAEREIQLLVPGLDDDVAILAPARELFRDRGTVVLVGGPEFVRLCRDKVAWSRELHPVCPAVVPAWTPEEAMKLTAAARIVFPLLAKPAAGSGSVGVSVLAGADALAALPSGFVVQPFLFPAATDVASVAVRGAAERGIALQVGELSFQLLFSAQGRLLGKMATRNSLKSGVPVEIVPIDDEPLWNALRPAIEHLLARGLRGPVNFQGRFTDDGPKFFEMNGRFTGITALRAMMGFNELEAAISDFLDLPAGLSSLFVNQRRIGLRQVVDRVVDMGDAPAVRRHVAARNGKGADREPLSVVVTGAAGWLGRHLVAALLADPGIREVVALVRAPERALNLLWAPSDRLRVVAADSSVSLHAELARADLLYHLAFAREQRPSLLAESLAFARRVTRAAARTCLPRLVLLSSQAVYGTSRPAPWPESLPPEPETPYAVAKLAAEEFTGLVKEASPSSRITSIRLARVYGAGDGLRWSEVPHLFAANAARNAPILIRGGQQVYDLLHLRDAVSALALFARPEQPAWAPVYNVGGGAPATLLEIGRAALGAARRRGRGDGDIRVEAAEGEPPRFGLDIRRFGREMGWSPRVSLGEAMDELTALAIASC